MATTKAAPATKSIPAQIEEARAKGGALAVLRVPFAENQIGLLPKAVSKQDTERFACKQGTKASVDGKFCGGYHTRSVHLDFVGHAALTDRLLEADPEWNWEPVGVDDFGMPKFDQNGGLWIQLTVGGVTRLGYGDSQGKSGPNAIKEAIGDALRNAGMRFGAALDLWHKGDLHDHQEEQGKLDPAAAVPAVEKTDWIGYAQEDKTADAALHTWRKAKAGGATKEELEKIAQIGSDLRDKEEAEAAAKEAEAAFSPADDAAAQLRGGFGGE